MVKLASDVDCGRKTGDDYIYSRLKGESKPYILISRKFGIENKALHVFIFRVTWKRGPLAIVNAQNNLAHNLKFAPVYTIIIGADKCLVAFFS